VNITVLIIIIILFNNRSSKIVSLLPSDVNPTTSQFINLSIQDKRIHQLLKSYSHVYEETTYECNITTPLTNEERKIFDLISTKMATLRTQMIPYPNEYFHGRGIVLTTGRKQLNFARINLKMLEKTGTRLPIQVIRLRKPTLQIAYLDLVFFI
jgi:hypothetical protein